MTPVDLRTHRLRAQIGVHCKGEIDRRRTLGQLEQSALRGEGEDAILVDRHARMLEQLFGIVAGIDDLDQVAQPADLAVRLVALFVGPMRSEAEFVRLVHFSRANLHFDTHRLAVDQRGMETAITVGFRRRDVVLEAAW